MSVGGERARRDFAVLASRGFALSNEPSPPYITGQESS